MARRRRLLFAITSLHQGGAEQLLFDTVAGLDRDRYEASILTIKDGGPYIERLRDIGVEVQSLGLRGKLGSPLALPRLRRLIRDAEPDILHAHLFHADLPCRLACGMLPSRQRPVFISHQHIPEQRWLPWRRVLERRTASWVDRFLCVSGAVQEHLRESLGSKLPISLLPNGRDLRPFQAAATEIRRHRRELREELGLADEQSLMGSVGRLDPQKDQALAVEALARLPGVHLLIAGEGPLREALIAQARELGVAERLHLLGCRSDIPEILAGLDLFLLSSRYEGFPIAGIEAMASGLACVLSDVPGNRELAGSGLAHLVPYGNPGLLAESCRELLAAPEARAQLGARAAKHAASAFSRERMVAELCQVYDELLCEQSDH